MICDSKINLKMSSKNIDKVCDILDKLTLDALTLMEQQIQLKLNVENAMCEGETNLAKARYIMGHNSVSSLQLPTENTPDFPAQVHVHSTDDDKLFGQKAFDLELVKNNDKDPLKWFGYLVPQNLNFAQNMFRQALSWAVQASNTQTQLSETCDKIAQLKERKNELKVAH